MRTLNTDTTQYKLIEKIRQGFMVYIIEHKEQEGQHESWRELCCFMSQEMAYSKWLQLTQHEVKDDSVN